MVEVHHIRKVAGKQSQLLRCSQVVRDDHYSWPEHWLAITTKHLRDTMRRSNADSLFPLQAVSHTNKLFYFRSHEQHCQES